MTPMTPADTGEVLAAVKVLWPHSNLGAPHEAVAAWHALLGRFDRADVEVAIRELAATGREHAPLVGQIVKAIADRAADAPEWDEAWQEIGRLIHRFGANRKPPAEAFSHPLIAAFARPAWSELCMGPAPGTRDYGTHHAQSRDAYKAMRGRVGRDAGLVAIGAPRRTSLKRLDALAALPAPPELEEAS